MSFRALLILAVCIFFAVAYWRKHALPARGTPEAARRLREIATELQQLAEERTVGIEQQKSARTEEELRALHKRSYEIDDRAEFLQGQLEKLK